MSWHNTVWVAMPVASGVSRRERSAQAHALKQESVSNGICTHDGAQPTALYTT